MMSHRVSWCQPIVLRSGLREACAWFSAGLFVATPVGFALVKAVAPRADGIRALAEFLEVWMGATYVVRSLVTEGVYWNTDSTELRWGRWIVSSIGFAFLALALVTTLLQRRTLF
jgi:hypothetical protein